MTENVRTRFAPSPTGFLHVGGLRTALYNYLFAKHYNGKLVLRIEDTDRSRYVPGATENLVQTLQTMSIDYDEGPDKEGSYSPYVQSERQELYKKHAQQLVDQEDAYHCFCTPDRLEEMRKKQEANGEQPKYDGTCRRLSNVEIKENLSEGKPYVIRLKMPGEGETVFQDLIRGEVRVNNEMVDDQILIKSDGLPTYHLANVVDDHFMEITHVIRGEEWLLSVPKHLQLYRAFNWQIPQLAHLPLLLNPDRSKLSKRQGDVAVEDFLKKGYLPQALNNFIALLGWNPGTDKEIFSMNELIEQFSLERVNKSGAVFDRQKLDWMNGHYIRELSESDRNKFLMPFLEKAGYDVSDREKISKIISGVYKNLSRGDEIVEKAAVFFRDIIQVEEEEARQIVKKDTAKTVLQTFLQKIEQLPQLTVDSFKTVMKEIQQETGIKKGELWMPIRVALTGVTHGPELPIVIEVFGKNKIQKFVQQVLEKY